MPDPDQVYDKKTGEKIPKVVIVDADGNIVSSFSLTLSDTQHIELDLDAVEAALGAPAGAAVTTDANGTIQQYLRGLIKLLAQAGGINVTANNPAVVTTDLGLSRFRSLSTASTAIAIKAGAGNIYGYNIVNRDAGAIVVKFYNKAAASVDPASDAPVLTVLVPQGGSVTIRGLDLPFSFSTAISVRCVTGLVDTDTTAATTKPIIEVDYK